MLTFKTREDWLRWRKSGIGASDAPIIMGNSDYSTPLKLYDQKRDKEPKEYESNYATDLGNEAEPKIRALCELQLGESFAACNLQHHEVPYLLASLDGRSKCKTKNLEIKLINKEDWTRAKEGIVTNIKSHNMLVPKQYYDQVQHQFMVSGAEVCYFAMYLFSAYEANRGKRLTLENLVILEVKPDIAHMEKLARAHADFWAKVVKGKPPEPGDKDYEPLTGLAKIANRWKKAKANLEKYEAELEAARKELIKEAEAKKHPRFICAGIRMALISKAGNVDYSKIPELNGVDLEKYRKPGSASWRLELLKKEKKNG